MYPTCYDTIKSLAANNVTTWSALVLTSDFCEVLPSGMIPCPLSCIKPQPEKLCSQLDEEASKTRTYVFLQSSNLFCFDRGTSHLYQLSEQLTVVASKLQDTRPKTGIKGTSLCPGNT